MYQKTMAWSARRPAVQAERNMDAAGHLLGLLYALSAELSINPDVYTTAPDTLWVYFKRSCIVCGALFEQYGISAANVSQKYPVYFLGETERGEAAELSARLSVEKDAILMEKKNFSGKNFEEISELCVKIEAGDPVCQRELAEIFRQLDYRSDFLAVRRSHCAERMLQSCPQLDSDTYYRFLPMRGGACGAACMDSLSVEQYKKLWLLLLEDEGSAVEFDLALAAPGCGVESGMFPWELALRLAMAECGVHIEETAEGIHIVDAIGRHRRYDYESGTAAEKMFLKVLFPAPAARGDVRMQ